ncbi:hypothetical protein OESDEN_23607 [Oesophagostomum dentatum]|uniref:Uncharacterized protein n=1 Tax=Oesophagostomum dentatum TaxID=61180 RepID=A0A0B1RUM0_OESDE|nr:hypothetical protein OESDEN_23607 [Oesophagostomum dentatum]
MCTGLLYTLQVTVQFNRPGRMPGYGSQPQWWSNGMPESLYCSLLGCGR